MDGTLTPVAQYLRMSTEHQIYSTANQRAAIAKFVADNRMEVVKTFEDRGKSGLTLGGRPALQNLLKEVLTPPRTFEAVVVYDVSRWGRFQDVDESAFYEYLCRRSNVNVIYCAESFDIAPGPMGTVIKSIKRAMAAEYSKELSVKVYASLQLLARQGFHTGGPAGFGLKRVQVSPDGRCRRDLVPGDRKSRSHDHVELEQGDPLDCGLVRLIFHLFVHRKLREAEIALQLNWNCYPSQVGLIPWRADAIRSVLRCEHYRGTMVFGAHTQRLRTNRRCVPKAQRIRVPNTFKSIVSPEDFDAAQRLVGEWKPRRQWSNSELLDLIRNEHAKRGSFSVAVLAKHGGPAAQPFIRRFGSVADACKAANIPTSRRSFTSGVRRKQRHALKLQILEWLADHYRAEGRTFYCHPSTRRACIDHSLTISVRVAHPQVSHNSIGWTLRSDRMVKANAEIFARVTDDGEVLDYFVIPGDESRHGFVNAKGVVASDWLRECRCESPADVIRKLDATRSTETVYITRMLHKAEAARQGRLGRGKVPPTHPSIVF